MTQLTTTGINLGPSLKFHAYNLSFTLNFRKTLLLPVVSSGFSALCRGVVGQEGSATSFPLRAVLVTILLLFEG